MGLCWAGFEKQHVSGGTAACAGRESRILDPRTHATGSVVGPLGQTGRLGLATERAAPGRWTRYKVPTPEPSRAIEANPQAGGTVHPNTSTRLAGRGPPMAGHVCKSVGGECLSQKQPQQGPGNACGGNPDRGSRRSDTYRGLAGPLPWRPMFSKTGFPKSCERLLGVTGKSANHRGRRKVGFSPKVWGEFAFPG